MPFDEKLALRIRNEISKTHRITDEKKMFSGLCFMVDDKMCVAVDKDRLMVRLDPAMYDEVLKKKGVRPMDFNGKVMKGYVFVNNEVIKTSSQLSYWIRLALDFNKRATSSRKKKK